METPSGDFRFYTLLHTYIIQAGVRVRRQWSTLHKILYIVLCIHDKYSVYYSILFEDVWKNKQRKTTKI